VDRRGFARAVWRGSDILLRLADRVREVISGGVGGSNRSGSSSWSRETSGFAEVLGDGGVWMSGGRTLGACGGDAEGGCEGTIGMEVG